jgi:hypothetical protein
MWMRKKGDRPLCPLEAHFGSLMGYLLGTEWSVPFFARHFLVVALVGEEVGGGLGGSFGAVALVDVVFDLFI